MLSFHSQRSVRNAIYKVLRFYYPSGLLTDDKMLTLPKINQLSDSIEDLVEGAIAEMVPTDNDIVSSSTCQGYGNWQAISTNLVNNQYNAIKTVWYHSLEKNDTWIERTDQGYCQAK
jgi:hypothetical protein